MNEPHDTERPPNSATIRAHGRGWAVAVPTAVACAVITALTNIAMRPTPDAHASAGTDASTREDIRELRSDVKQILTRLGGLEDAVNNARVIDGARGRGGTP